MIDNREFKKALGDVFRRAGYRQKSNAWYLLSADVIVVVELQKSNYDKTQFLNVGLYLRELGSDIEPRERLCHIRCRAERITPMDEPQLEAMNLGLEEWPPSEHVRHLQTFLITRLMPRIQDLLQLTTLRAELSTGRLRGCFVHPAARDMLVSRSF